MRGSAWTVDILYGDFEGGQRVVTRFGLLPLPGAMRPTGEQLWAATGTSSGPQPRERARRRS